MSEDGESLLRGRKGAKGPGRVGNGHVWNMTGNLTVNYLRCGCGWIIHTHVMSITYILFLDTYPGTDS